MSECSLIKAEGNMAANRQQRKETVTKLRKQQILEAAFEVFSHNGFNAATTAEIAKAAGVAEGTLYNYYPSKRDLFIAVIQDTIITEPLLELLDRLPHGDIAGTFALIMQERFRLMQSGIVSRMPVLMADVIKDPELRTLWVHGFLQPFLDKVEAAFRALQTTGVYRDIEPKVAVRAIGGMIIGFLILKTAEGPESPLETMDAAKVTGSFTELLLHGVLKET